MNRRRFFAGLFGLGVTATVAPAVITSANSEWGLLHPQMQKINYLMEKLVFSVKAVTGTKPQFREQPDTPTLALPFLALIMEDMDRVRPPQISQAEWDRLSPQTRRILSPKGIS